MGDRGQGSRHELGGGEPDLAGGRLDRAGLQAGAPVVLATRQGQSSQGDRAGADDVTQDQAHLAHVAGREIGDVVPPPRTWSSMGQRAEAVPESRA